MEVCVAMRKWMRWCGWVVLLAIAISLTAAPLVSPAATAPEAKNVILMISDGCGYNHMWAADLFETGAVGTQPYEQFPVRCGVSTNAANTPPYDPALAWATFNWVKDIGATDSAAAGTALAAGVKTNKGAIGVDVAGKPVENVLERAEKLGKSTGIVTSVTFSDATPAAFGAHVPSRNAEEEIARQMLMTSAVDVIMGTGHPWYDNAGKRRPEPNYEYVGGKTTWVALSAGTAGADADGDGEPDPWKLIESKADFAALTAGPTPKRVCGVPQCWDTLEAARNLNFSAAPYTDPFPATVPTLCEMTEGALNVLDDDPEGFVLMVEGGAIDGAAHVNVGTRMVEEQMEFNKAVEAVIEWVERHSDWNATLLIVTADHETGYVTGPGSDPKWQPLTNNGPGKMPGLEFHSKSHTNSLVPLFAKGAGAEAFTEAVIGTDPQRGEYVDNTTVAKVIMKALR
jgi:alkaline phosphatase